MQDTYRHVLYGEQGRQNQRCRTYARRTHARRHARTFLWGCLRMHIAVVSFSWTMQEHGHPSIHLSTYSCIHLPFIYLSIHLSTYSCSHLPFIYISIHLSSIHQPPIHASIHPPIIPSSKSVGRTCCSYLHASSSRASAVAGPSQGFDLSSGIARWVSQPFDKARGSRSARPAMYGGSFFEKEREERR